MSVKELLWIDELAARDWHLLPGYVSPQFNQLLTIKDTRGDRPGDKPHGANDIAFSIHPPIKGVSVDAKTGQIKVTDDPFIVGTALLPKSTWLTCHATANATITAFVHVRVHGALSSLYLSPASLTVRKGARGVRYAVIGVFSDTERGDLSNWSPRKSQPREPGDQSFVRLAAGGTVETDPAIRFAVGINPVGVDVDMGSGVIECTRADAKGDITAILQVAPPAIPPMAPDAFTAGADPWDQPVVLKKLDGADFSAEAMRERRNVLILPDGFTASWEFDRIVAEAVKRLTSRAETSPFNLCKDQFNFFSAWVPSPDEDVTVLNAVTIGPSDSYARDAASVPGTLLNDQNTAFHTAIGYRPTSNPGNETHQMGFNPLRLDDRDFKLFLGALTDDKGNAKGEVWASGKDRTLIVIISRSGRFGATNFPSGSGRVIAVATNPTEKVETAPTSAGAKIVPTSIFSLGLDPEPIFQRCWLTMAHELAHSFGLLDEYGNRTDTMSGIEIAGIDASLNTQRRETLVNSLDELEGGALKWDWPRIERAARYVKLAVQSANPRRFDLKLDPVHARRPKPHQFVEGDVVRLRGTGHLLKPPILSDGLKVLKVKKADIVLEVLTGLQPPPPDLLPAPPAQAPPGYMIKHRVGSKILHTLVQDAISTTRNPTNAGKSEPQGRACTTGSTPLPTPARNIPAAGPAFKPPKHPHLIVGLYETGATFRCGVYHPTGSCAMISEKDKTGQTLAREFCHVCRYALVDQIDPAQHGAIDADYKYPG